MTHEELDAMCHDEEETERLYEKFLETTGFPQQYVEKHCLVSHIEIAEFGVKHYMKKPILCVVGRGIFGTFPVLFCEG